MIDDALEAHLAAARAEHPKEVTQIPLGLAQVVGLGEPLPGEELVGDLRLAPPSVGVVDRGAPGRPLDERPPRLPGAAAHLLPQAPVALRIDDDRAQPASDRADGDPRLRDRLAGTGCPNDQYVAR